MSEWQPIETAPRDGTTILIFGQPDDLLMADGSGPLVQFSTPGTFTAAWDEIDDAFVLSGGSWLGPFVAPTHWMPLPSPPKPP